MKKAKQSQHRNTYTPAQRDSARRYYLMGLTLPEISKLLDGVPVRTLQKWQLSDKWTAHKETTPIKTKVLELHNAGKSYNDIAHLLNISRVTVWRWLKEAKESD